jgi:hypothetical protein
VRWTEARLAGERDPRLRARVPRERVAVSWAGPTQHGLRTRAVRRFAAVIADLDRRGERGGAAASAWRDVEPRLPRPLRYAAQAGLVLASGALLGFLADSPELRLRAADEAVVTLSFSHPGRPRQECRQPSAEELARLEPNMRRPTSCPRGRWPVYAELELGGRLVYAGASQPAGLWDDGPSSLFRRFVVPAGPQRATVRMRDSGREAGFDFSETVDVDLEPGRNLVIEFRQPGGFVFQ